MTTPPPVVAAVCEKLKRLRKQRGQSTQQLEEELLLGPGWIERLETGTLVLGVDLLLAWLAVLDVSPADFFREGAEGGSPVALNRAVWAEPRGADLLVHFRYADHDASYVLPGASLDQFETVAKAFRDGLALQAGASEDVARARKTQAVVNAFLLATRLWPHANPSDLWLFLISRMFCDPFNHPATEARRDFGQSWKRTAGWALEAVVVRHYGPFLAGRGVQIEIATGERKRELVEQLRRRVADRLEADKIDVLLVSRHRDREICFGVLHVKASFAERRTDDVPLSDALIRAGFVSPLWTLDCKSLPSASPTNRGELGAVATPGGDPRSAKRKDIEDEGYFSACFSYNRRTLPTPPSQQVAARVVVCDFSTPDDAFSAYLLEQWELFRATL